MVSVCLAGASGFIGRNLIQRLKKEGYNVSLITRNDFKEGNIQVKIDNCAIVINLVGKTIAGLWTKANKRKIYESRIYTTRKLVEAINKSENTVNLLIQVSAVGIYDCKHVHTEASSHFDNGFLSRVILDWEGELKGILSNSVRIVVLRLGVVLDTGGGILKKIRSAFKLGIGFGIKSEDHFPFIQLDDLIDAFIFSIKNLGMSGVVNVVAPVAPTIRQFYRELGAVLNVRFVIWIRKKTIMLLMGESGILLCQGQKVVPSKLLKEGFIFTYKNIEDALKRTSN